MFIDEYEFNNVNKSTPQVSIRKLESKWEGPNPGLTKTNVNASYFTNGFTIVGE